MKFIETADFTADRPWSALDVVTMTGATGIRPHWNDQPCRWHINDGEEIFVVVDGAVDMHYRDAGQGCIRTLIPGTICSAGAGDEHVARPQGEARMLAIGKGGSVQPTATAADSAHFGIPVTALLPQLGEELIVKLSRSIATVTIGTATVLGTVAASPAIIQAISCPLVPVYKYEGHRFSGFSASINAFKVWFNGGVYTKPIVEALDLVDLQVSGTQVAYAGDIIYKGENGNFWVK